MTRIMYGCGLTHRDLRKYLDFLTAKGFVSVAKREAENFGGFHREMQLFQTTEKGTVLLLALENLDTMLGLPIAKYPVATATTT